MRNPRFGTPLLLATIGFFGMLASTTARAQDFFPGMGERLYPSPSAAVPAAVATPPVATSPAATPAPADPAATAPRTGRVSLQDLIRGRAPAPIVLSAPLSNAVAVPVAAIPSAPAAMPEPAAEPVRKPMSLRELADYLARSRGETSAPAVPAASPPAAFPNPAPSVDIPAVAASSVTAEPLAEIAAPAPAVAPPASFVPETAAAAPSVASETPASTAAIGAAIDGTVAAVGTGTMLPRRIEVATTQAEPAADATAKKDPASPFTAKDPAFAGSDLFVGRSVKAPTDTYRVEIGVAGQVVPLNLLLAGNRTALIDSGVSAACANSKDPNCATAAASYAGQAINVINSIPDAQWDGVVAASSDPTALAKTLKSVGVTSASDIAAVQKYLATIPSSKRTEAIMLARHLEGADASVRLEPYANVDLKHAQIRLGVPMSVGVGTGSSFDMGNLNVDLATGWNFPVKHASFGVSVGLQTYLPTSTGSESISLMADLFQASKYLYGYMSFAPYVVAGVDAKWVSLQVHGDLWLQARVRSISAASNAEVFQYGTGLTILPHFPVSVVGQLEGLEGLHNAGAFRSLFVVAGLQFNLWYVRLGVAAQVPIMDRAKENLGSYAGMDVGGLAKYTVLARTAASF